MSETKLAELDKWIGEHFIQSIPDGIPVRFEPLPGILIPVPNDFFQHLPFSFNPTAFAIVKREIERRGWSWHSHYEQDYRNSYRFEIHCFNCKDVSVKSNSEELAGCLAVKEMLNG